MTNIFNTEIFLEDADFKIPPAIVLGMSANGLSIARTLGRKGIPVIGVSNSTSEPCVSSKYLKKFLITPNAAYHEKEFLSFLISLGKSLNRRGAIFTTGDEFILTISKHREILSKYFNFLIPPHELVKRFLDKKESYKLAREFKIPYPNTYFTDDGNRIDKIAGMIKYPCILKPCLSHLWRNKYNEKKVFINNTPEELIKNYGEARTNQLEVIVQEIIPGPDKNVHEFMAFFNETSEVLAYFCGRKIRQYPPHFGIGSLSESIYNQHIIDLGVSFLKKVGYRGLVHIEFKINEITKEPYFLEANLRTSLIGELSIASGIDLPYVAYKNMMLGYNKKEEENFNFQEGVKLINIKLDVGSFIRYRKNKELSLFDWVKSYKAKKIAHTYFCLDDIKPFLSVYSQFLAHNLRKLPLLFKTALKN